MEGGGTTLPTILSHPLPNKCFPAGETLAAARVDGYEMGIVMKLWLEMKKKKRDKFCSLKFEMQKELSDVWFSDNISSSVQCLHLNSVTLKPSRFVVYFGKPSRVHALPAVTLRPCTHLRRQPLLLAPATLCSFTPRC